MDRTLGTQSTKHKKNSRSNHDLITTIETNIASPMSQWQPTTQRNRQIRNLNGTSRRTIDDFDQELLQELNSLFITSDQQRIIRQILQFARKGKINSGNAFEIPIKVVNPKSTENINMKFWKLSSQLLNSSSNIYDKRVENLYLNSNKVMNDLLRIKEDNIQSKESQQNFKDESNIKIDFPQQGSKLKLSSNQIKYAHLEQIQKLSLNCSIKTVIKDSFLLQKTKGIDSNSLSGLMINVLELGPDLSLVLDEYYQQSQMELTDGQQSEDFSNIIRNQVELQYTKLKQISKQQQLLAQLSRFVDRYIARSHENQNIQRQLQQLFENSRSYSANFYKNNNQQTILSVCNQDTNNIFSRINHSQIAEVDSFVSDIKTQKLSISCKEPFKKLSNLADMQDDREGSFTIIAPWEIQFKLKKLNVKKQNNGLKKGSKKSMNQNTFEIDFQFGFEEKYEILDITHNTSVKNIRKPKLDKFILPKTINPYLQVYKAKRLKSQAISKILTDHMQHSSIDKQSEFLANQLAHSHFQIQNDPLQNVNYPKISQQNETFTQSDINLHNLTQQQIINLRTFGIRNIRQTKQQVFQQLMNRSSIKIGEVKSELAPSGMLIIFLHLANQKNLNIQSIDNECDVRLSVNF